MLQCPSPPRSRPVSGIREFQDVRGHLSLIPGETGWWRKGWELRLWTPGQCWLPSQLMLTLPMSVAFHSAR